MWLLLLTPRACGRHKFGHVVQELLLFLVQAFAVEYDKVLILMEDIHYFDTISLQLVADAVQNLSPYCLIITTLRPSSGIFANAVSREVCQSLQEEPCTICNMPCYGHLLPGVMTAASPAVIAYLFGLHGREKTRVAGRRKFTFQSVFMLHAKLEAASAIHQQGKFEVMITLFKELFSKSSFNR